MKSKKLGLILTALLLVMFAVFAMGSGEGTTDDQGNGEANKGNIGKYSVTIDSCRLAKDYEGKAVVIVKYTFTNVSDDEPACFAYTFDDSAFQNGVGLNDAYFLDDSADYNSDNQTKEIKKGASIQVEVAYVLNDMASEVEVEVKELFSFDKTAVKKTFSIV